VAQTIPGLAGAAKKVAGTSTGVIDPTTQTQSAFSTGVLSGSNPYQNTSVTTVNGQPAIQIGGVTIPMGSPSSTGGGQTGLNTLQNIAAGNFYGTGLGSVGQGGLGGYGGGGQGTVQPSYGVQFPFARCSPPTASSSRSRTSS
jgi:hypothetical protein